MIRRRLRPFVIGSSLILLLSTAGWQLAAGSSSAPQTDAPRPVWSGAVTAPGVVEPASRLIELRSPLSGRLARVLVQGGDAVTKGQLLAELENAAEREEVALRAADYRRAVAEQKLLTLGARRERRAQAWARVGRAQAERKLARIELSRARSLAKDSVRSQRDVDVAEATARSADSTCIEATAAAKELDAGARPVELERQEALVALALAAWRRAKAHLEKTRLRSPVDGMCVRRHREPGESVAFTTDTRPVLTLAGGSLRARVDLDARDLGRVKVGQSVEVDAAAYPGEAFAGRVLRIERIAGRKNVRTERPREKVDAKVVEVVVQLAATERPLPFGLEVIVRFERDGGG